MCDELNKVVEAAEEVRDEAQETARVVLPGEMETCENVSVTLGRASLRKEGEDLLLEQTLRVSALCRSLQLFTVNPGD